jgi:hypothetical protein
VDVPTEGLKELPYDTWSYFAPIFWVKMLQKTLEISWVKVHLNYNVVAHLRHGVCVIVVFAMYQGMNKKYLMAFIEPEHICA